MAVVVTGASGFIGQHVTALLEREGHAVIGVDRRAPAGASEHVRAELAVPTPEVTRLLAAADAVIHLAGCPGVRDRAPDVEVRRERDNVRAGQTVTALTPADVPLVIVSSSSVYGGARDGRASHEDDPLDPRGGYARSKVRLERVAAARRERGGLTTVVRPFTVAGEGQRADMALARWLDAATSDAPLRILGSLDRTRDVTDVVAVATALVRAIERSPQTTLNLGTGTPVTLRALVDAVAIVTGRELDVRVEPASEIEVPDTRADTRRCAAVLGSVPSTDLHDLVARQHAASGRASRLPVHPHSQHQEVV